MHHLAPDNAHRALPLLDQVPGRVYVDDVLAPTACYVLHAHGMALLAGDSQDPDFRRALRAYLRDDDGRRDHREFLQVHPAAWSPWVEEALTDAPGSVLFDGNQWSAVASSAFLLGNQWELGVETHPAYRRRGLGAVACRALVAACVEHGHTPLWSCHAGNLTAAKLAGRMGFTLSRRHPYCELGMRVPQAITPG